MENLEQQGPEMFSDLTQEERKLLRESFGYKKYRKGDYIIKEGDKVESIYHVLKGLLKLSYTDSDAKEHILSFASEGWWETDFSAFYLAHPAVLTLQCLEDSEVNMLAKSFYTDLTKEYPTLTQFFLDKSIRGHIASQTRILSLLNQAPKHRYEQFLKSYPHLVQRIPKTILSSYLGVSRETLSRLYLNDNSSKK